MKRPSPVSRYTYAPCGACGQRKPCLRLESDYGETFTCRPWWGLAPSRPWPGGSRQRARNCF